MAVHVARLGLVYVTATGNIKQHTNMTIGEAANASSEWRVLPDSSNANTDGHPTIESYLTKEDAAGFNFLRHLSQNLCITYDA